MIEKLAPKDLLAILLVLGLIVFKLTGHNGTFDTPVAIIIGYYFAKRNNGEDAGK